MVRLSLPHPSERRRAGAGGRRGTKPRGPPREGRGGGGRGGKERKEKVEKGGGVLPSPAGRQECLPHCFWPFFFISVYLCSSVVSNRSPERTCRPLMKSVALMCLRSAGWSSSNRSQVWPPQAA